MSEKVVNNLELWERVEKTDPKYTKNTSYGRKFTSVNAQYQIMNATREWGLYGFTWGIKHIEYEIIRDLPHEEILVLAKAVFFYPSAEFPISSTIKMVTFNKKAYEENARNGINNPTTHLDDEWAKKIETDITTKALSKLGFNADIFLGRYDDNRYMNQVRDEFKEPTPEKKEAPKKVAKSQEMTYDQYNNTLAQMDKATEEQVAKARAWAERFADAQYKTKMLRIIETKEKGFKNSPVKK